MTTNPPPPSPPASSPPPTAATEAANAPPHAGKAGHAEQAGLVEQAGHAGLHTTALRLARRSGFVLDIPPLSVQPGDNLTVMGGSGSGKSTLLLALVGLVDDELTIDGETWLNGNNITHRPPHQRRIGIVFQEDNLFPHMTIAENLLFALNGREARTHPRHAAGHGNPMPRKLTAKQRTQEALRACELDGLGNRYPQALSGGQRARVAVMRCLLSEPSCVVMDEPFSGLDKALRQRFRAFVFDELLAVDVPFVLVTHDEDDIPQHGQLLRLGGDGIERF